MASKSKTAEKEDAPLIDLNEASIKKLIAKAKKKGYVTYDELNDGLPSAEMSPDQIEDIQTALSEMGVQIVENDEEAEAEAEAEPGELVLLQHGEGSEVETGLAVAARPQPRPHHVEGLLSAGTGADALKGAQSAQTGGRWQRPGHGYG